MPNLALGSVFVNQAVTVDIAAQDYVPQKQKYSAWQYYRQLLENEANGTLMPKDEGAFVEARSYILERMKALVDDERVSQEVNPLAKDFLKNLQNNMDTLPKRKEMIQRAYLFLPTKQGVQIFSLFGDLYLEEGDLEKASDMYEKAYKYSIGFDSLNSQARKIFFTKLAFCYSRLQWQEKLDALLSSEEIEHLSKIKKQPLRKEKAPKLNYIFDRSTETEKLIVLNENGEQKWFFEKENYRWLSEPYFTKNKVFLVTAKVEKHYFNASNLFLFVLDKETGHLLREQHIAENGEAFKAQKGYVRPYSLIEYNGEIILFTEAFEARFNNEGEIILLYDYSIIKKDKSIELLIRFLKEDEKPSDFTINIALILREIFYYDLPPDESKKNILNKIVWEDAFQHENITFRRRAMGSESSFSLDNHIQKALDDVDKTVRTQAALAWVPLNIEPPYPFPKEVEKARTILFDILENAQDEVLRYGAIDSLKRIVFYTNVYSKEQVEGVMALYVKLLKDENITIKHQAMKAILEVATSAFQSGLYERTFEDSARFISPFVSQLYEALYDEDEYIKTEAAVLLGIVADKGTAAKEDLEKTVPRLIELSLNEEETADVKKRSAEALGYIKSPKATDALIQILNTTKNFKLRKKVIYALGRMGDQKAALALINILKEDDAFWIGTAYRGLTQIENEETIRFVIHELTSELQNTVLLKRYLAATGIVFFKDYTDTSTLQSTIPILIEGLTLENEEGRIEAIELLGEIGLIVGRDTIFEKVQSQLQQESKKIKRATAYTLSLLWSNDKDSNLFNDLMQVLENTYQDENGVYHLKTVESLERLLRTEQNPERRLKIIELLKKALQSVFTDVSQKAQEVLSSIKNL